MSEIVGRLRKVAHYCGHEHFENCEWDVNDAVGDALAALDAKDTALKEKDAEIEELKAAILAPGGWDAVCRAKDEEIARLKAPGSGWEEALRMQERAVEAESALDTLRAAIKAWAEAEHDCEHAATHRAMSKAYRDVAAAEARLRALVEG